MRQEQQGARCRALTSRKNGLPARLEKGRGRFALCTAEGLRALSGSLAPLAQRALKGNEECETADADSHPMPSAPEGRIIRQTVCLAAPALPVLRSIT